MHNKQFCIKKQYYFVLFAAKKEEALMKKQNCTTNIFVKECIAQALSKLIEEKPLADIKITELARIAGVSRMTYYRNFNSKEDIFSAYFDIMFTRYDEAEGYLQPFGIYHDKKHMIHYFRFVLEYKDFLRAVINHGYGNIFLTTMTDYIVKKWLKNKSNQTEYYTLCAFSGSLYSLYVSWEKNNFRETPEKMAEILLKIHGNGKL